MSRIEEGVMRRVMRRVLPVGAALMVVAVLAAGSGVARAQDPGAVPAAADQFLQPGVVTASGPCDPSLGSASSCGVATARFNRVFVQCPSSVVSPGVTGIVGGGFCLDPASGQVLAANIGSILNGTVFFTIDDPSIATWVSAQPTATQPAPSSTAGFVTTAQQTAVRCGFFPTTSLPFSTVNTGSNVTSAFPPGSPLSSFFGGCESASATYRGLAPGMTRITATFVPDLPGASGAGVPALPFGQPFLTSTPFLGLPSTVSPLLGQFAGASQPSATAVLSVIGAAPAGTVPLASTAATTPTTAAAATVSIAAATGCNNVTPTVTEPAAQYAARVQPASVVIAVWEHQAATNSFLGAPGPSAPASAQAVADLTTVTRLRPVFVCVSAPGTLNQPAA
jgi:hypothetical protein